MLQKVVNIMSLHDHEESQAMNLNPDLELILSDFSSRFGHGSLVPHEVKAWMDAQMQRPQVYLEHASYDDEGYSRNVLFETKQTELVLVGWQAGQETPKHDHEGRSCSFMVLSGDIEEVRFDSSGHVSAQLKHQARDIVQISDPTAIHQMACRQGRALSLHIYSPPMG
ncbi:MAG: hypothetical protein CL675_02210 [Bdellovibrionaceae bacterium]|nr:hypothetical protein [Pseudobdellovibrionaceae bacterium]